MMVCVYVFVCIHVVNVLVQYLKLLPVLILKDVGKHLNYILYLS